MYFGRKKKGKNFIISSFHHSSFIIHYYHYPHIQEHFDKPAKFNKLKPPFSPPQSINQSINQRVQTELEKGTQTKLGALVYVYVCMCERKREREENIWYCTPFAAAQPTPRPQRSEKKHEGKKGGKKESSPVHIYVLYQ